MSRLPLCSSEEIVKALQRAGFQSAHRSPGSHLTLSKRVGKRTITTVVVLGKREVPRPTLRKILRLAQLTDEEFLTYLRS